MVFSTFFFDNNNAFGYFRRRRGSSCVFQATCLRHSRRSCSSPSCEKKLFRVSGPIERERERRIAAWGEPGTEIINARLPATPHYSVRVLCLSTPLHRECSHGRKQKAREKERENRVLFLVARNFTRTVDTL